MKNFLLIGGFAVVLFLTGCASTHTWKGAGREIFLPESNSLKKMPDGSVLLTRRGIVKEYYLPFFECFAVESEQERKTYFSLNGDFESPKTKIVVKFRIKKDAKNDGNKRIGTEEYGDRGSRFFHHRGKCGEADGEQ